MEENISFARKYRPNTLEKYIGNSEIKETVKRYLKTGRPQSILLTGNSGCGKTSLARLIAKEYFCEDRDPETGACDECMSCETMNDYIKTGNTEMLTDLYEIDSSDKSGKKDIDAMLESMQYPAMGGDWKVYIVDEVHLLSAGAMGRLLKSLEEPPQGVLMILCTTDPDKLLDTIINRCQLKMEVKKSTTSELVNFLRNVCLEESKDYDIPGLRSLVVRAENVVRDSLNNLERVLNTRGSATYNSVNAEFKEVSEKLIFDFYEAFQKKDYLGYVNVLYQVKTKYDFGQFLISLTNFTTRGIYILNSVDVEGLTEEELKSYMALFKKFSIKDISYILSSLRRMNLGDIEANFMAFIYTDNNDKEEDIPVVHVTESTVAEEKTLRNSNLQRLETAKLEEGSKSIKSEMEPVGLKDMKGFFTVEKVN
jgi:DNA polymerase-3 subunit gamma/tau